MVLKLQIELIKQFTQKSDVIFHYGVD